MRNLPRLPSPAELPLSGEFQVGPFRRLPDLVRAAGHDPEEVFALAGTSTALLEEPTNRMTFRAAGRLIRRAVERTGIQDLGLQLGASADMDSLGIPALLMRQASTVEEALKILVRTLHLRDRGAVVTFSATADTARLGYAVYERGVESRDQISDLVIAIGLNIMRALCGASFRPTGVRLARPEPADTAPYRRLFGRGVRFDASEDTLLFSARWLQRPLPGGDPALRRVLDEHVARLDAEMHRTLLERLRPMIRGALADRDCSVKRISVMLSMNRRTLNRQLKQHGTTFRKVIGEVRFSVAAHLLANTHAPLADIAHALDYSDPAVFTRAFERWSGVSPSRWRIMAGTRVSV
ncbi:MAG TPA: AraC family transcriptional regulator [Thermoanaerobaculia bacterium]|nr:AraC family transcriptional regulator [Thermoanaerobaculia bacterium]